MAQFTYDLNPVDFIIADAVGEPGKRTFYLQARAGRQSISLVLEKQEVNNLAASVLQLRFESDAQSGAVALGQVATRFAPALVVRGSTAPYLSK